MPKHQSKDHSGLRMALTTEVSKTHFLPLRAAMLHSASPRLAPRIDTAGAGYRTRSSALAVGLQVQS